MTNELMKVHETIPGMEDISREDLVIPRLQANCKRGMFENLLTGESMAQLKGVLLCVRKGMVMFDPEMLEAKPVCKSFDRKTGTKYGNCEGCDFRKFNDARNKVLCRATYEFLLKLEDNLPYALTISTYTSYGQAKKYLTSFVANHEPLYAYETKISMQEEKNKDGKGYYVVKFAKGDKLPEQSQADFNAIMKDFRYKEVVEEELAPVKNDDFFTGDEVPA